MIENQFVIIDTDPGTMTHWPSCLLIRSKIVDVQAITTVAAMLICKKQQTMPDLF